MGGDDVTASLVVFWLFCGGITAGIGSAKNRSVGQSLALGLLLGIVGVFIVAVLPKEPPKPPPGMVVVQCPRCNAVQNIPHGQTTFECWQCKLVSNVVGARYASGR
jgi:hypothetical protein